MTTTSFWRVIDLAWGDIPDAARTRLASERVRMFHALWHLVRNEGSWNTLEAPQKDELIRQGWTPPRFERQPGAGIDFLYMHRRMIQMVNLSASGETHRGHHEGTSQVAGFVRPWVDIPWDHADPVWPMSVVDRNDPRVAAIFGRSKEQATTDFYRARASEAFQNREWLGSQSLDQLGTQLEFTIHGWMHMH